MILVAMAIACAAGLTVGYFVGGRSGFVQGYDLGYEAAKQYAAIAYREAHAAQQLKEHNATTEKK